MRKAIIGGSVVVVIALVIVGLIVPVVSPPRIWHRTLYGSIIELETPGGPLPFKLSYHQSHTQTNGWVGFIWDIWDEQFDVDVVSPTNNPDDIIVRFPHYDSELVLQKNDDGRMVGEWTKQRGGGTPAVVKAQSGNKLGDTKFQGIEHHGESANFDGRWAVRFESSDDLAIGDFYLIPMDDQILATGTFLTTTGDYRYLSGRVDGNLMRLSTFDGAHAFLFHARMQDDGTIEGDFWSGNWHHETWTAVRDDNAALPDAFEQTSVTDETKLDKLVFKDLDGKPTRVLDLFDDSKSKARVIEIFGSWCPNCSDASRELVLLKAKYGDDLAVVGLAFELTEDFDRSVTQVQRHHEYLGTDWPILIAGLNDKEQATKTLGFLDQVRSYPTLVFLNEHNEVVGVYSGFSGPATGDAYTNQLGRLESLIERMIEE